jgi:hypothetical protein
MLCEPCPERCTHPSFAGISRGNLRERRQHRGIARYLSQAQRNLKSNSTIVVVGQFDYAALKYRLACQPMLRQSNALLAHAR